MSPAGAVRGLYPDGTGAGGPLAAGAGRAAAVGRAASNTRVATVGPGGRGWPQQQHQQLFQQPQQLSHPQHPLARQASPPRNGGIRSISEFRPSGRFVLG